MQPVLDAIRLYHKLGVWVEVTTLVIPGLNDSNEELTGIAELLCDLDPAIPWHISQYYPTYRMLDHPPTPVETLHRAREIGQKTGLRYVYEGNVPGEGGENTYCYECGALLIERFGFFVRQNRIQDSRCPDCDISIDGMAMSQA
jgi:pyruvate formate lyase activating enzyme